MANFFDDNDDLRFYFERGVDWAPLVRLLERDFRAEGGPRDVDEAVSSYRDVLALVGELAAEELAPYAAELDRAGVRFTNGEVQYPPRAQTVLDRLRDAGLYGICVPRELGGLHCPLLLHYFASELIGRAEVSVLTHYGFHAAIAATMLAYSIHEGTTTYDIHSEVISGTRWKDEIARIIRGEAWGSMDITEPNAGSDMARIGTRAVYEDGRWYVTGQKIFITSGHGRYHFVIARSEDPQSAPGLDGLSLFLVPAFGEENGAEVRRVQVERVEEKLGHHLSATCVVRFERSPAELVGKRGEGFKLMLTLMNGARIAVGFEGLGLSEAAYRAAATYAAERPSMGKTIDRHEMIADYFDEMRTDIQGIRALTVYGAYHEEMAMQLDMALRLRVEPGSEQGQDYERARRYHRTASRRVTPLIKYLASEKAIEIARRSLQIHGGVGYTKEYAAERYLRESIAMPIYEGTSQIQALMAMKDTLGAVLKSPQDFVTASAQARWRSLSARDELERRTATVQTNSLAAQQHLLSRTATDKLKAMFKEPVTHWPRAIKRNWDPKRDFALAMLHAERLTRLLCDAAICEILLEQAKRYPDRRDVLERYLERAEPRSRHLLDEITNTGERLLNRLHGTSSVKQSAS